MNIKEVKIRIENMSKYHQIEILRIFVKEGMKNINENKNGSFINLTEVSDKTIEIVRDYIKYVDTQTQELSNAETKMSKIQETFFKGDKDNRNV
tara:strand:- start:858 stop:1139 length:282 start_codon:yes stop_codon:yes gene_type:complete